MDFQKEIEELKQEIKFLKQVMFTKADGDTHYKKNKQRVYDLFKTQQKQLISPPVLDTTQQEIDNLEPVEDNIMQQDVIDNEYLLSRGIASILIN